MGSTIRTNNGDRRRLAAVNAEEWKRKFQRTTECAGNKMSDGEWARQWDRQSERTTGIVEDKAVVLSI
jgi:hypothetical protein